MKRLIAIVAVGALLTPSVALAVGGNKAQYIGGTIAGLKENAEGKLNTATEDAVTFTPDKKEMAPVAIPYASITELEYGQKAGRRVGVAIMVSPLALFSKKRKHFLTVTYRDQAGKDQAAVFELGKDIVRTTVKVIETRSGKDVQYQDEEARKALGGGKS